MENPLDYFQSAETGKNWEKTKNFGEFPTILRQTQQMSRLMANKGWLIKKKMK